MPLKQLIVFEGKGSMTGDATETRFPGVKFKEGSTFDDILKTVENSNAIAVLPLWNSHLGEIKKTKIIEVLFEKGFHLHAIWPHWIDVACIVKKATKEESIKTIISFAVVSVQCSEFIKRMRKKFGTQLDEGGSKSTKDAYRKFSRSGKWDAVLCRAELSDNDQNIFIENVANKMNFTTFVLLGKVPVSEWNDSKWNSLKTRTLPNNCQISGIEMPGIEGSLSDEQHDLFDYFLEDISHLDEIPKIIFAAEKEYGKIRLLLEHKVNGSTKHFPDIDFMSDVNILNDIGSTKLLYTEEVKNFLPSRYGDSLSKDFVKHIGVQTYFYACPSLNILVHGFDEDIVEVIARESIVNHFRAIERGSERSQAQEDFFNRYKDDYLEKGTEFPVFEYA